MITQVDMYRGWEISFDTDKETFTAYSNSYDNEISDKQSYSSTKKWIDDFMKNNETFKPFFVVNEEGKDKVKIVGVRKDGRFVQEKNGVKSQFSSYHEGRYIIYSPELDQHIAEYKNLMDIHHKAYQKAVKYREENIKGKTLTEYKKELSGN